MQRCAYTPVFFCAHIVHATWKCGQTLVPRTASGTDQAQYMYIYIYIYIYIYMYTYVSYMQRLCMTRFSVRASRVQHGGAANPSYREVAQARSPDPHLFRRPRNAVTTVHMILSVLGGPRWGKGNFGQISGVGQTASVGASCFTDTQAHPRVSPGAKTIKTKADHDTLLLGNPRQALRAYAM